jgi:hypothetical protein
MTAFIPQAPTTKNPSAPVLAGTLFQTGIDETLVAVDVYQQAGSGIINGFLQDISEAVSDTLMGATIDSPLDLSGIDAAALDMVGSVASEGAAGLTDMASSLSISSPSAMSALNMVNSTVKAGISQANQLKNEIQTTISGVTSTIHAATMGTVAGINGMVAGLTNTITAPIKDITTYVNAATNTINQATKIGMSGVYSSFAAAATTSTAMLNQITKGVLPTVVATSNLSVLGEVASGPVGKQINLLQPNFIPNYLNAFTQPFTSLSKQIQNTGNTLAKDYTQMQKAFSSIAPAWQNTTRNAQAVLSGAPFVAASTQAINTIQSGMSLSALNANIKATTTLVNNVNTLVNNTAQLGSKLSTTFNTVASAPAEAYMLMTANTPVTNVTSAIAGEIPSFLMA